MRLEEAVGRLEALEALAPPLAGTVRVEDGDGRRTLVLDNPRAKGAMTIGMMAQLGRAVSSTPEEVGIVVVRGREPGCFCSGGHLRQVRAVIDSRERAEEMGNCMTAVLDGLLALPAITVAAVDGPALGGGAELAVACDFRAFGPRGRLGFVHTELGIAPGWGATGRLVRLLGRSAALQVLLRAERIDGRRALECGLADAVGDTLESASAELLSPFQGRSTATTRAVKRQILAAELGDRAAETRAFSEVWGGPAHVAALEALRRHST